MTEPTDYEIQLLVKAKEHIAKSRVRYGDESAYPADCELMLDLIGQIESLRAALDADAALAPAAVGGTQPASKPIADQIELAAARHVLRNAVIPPAPSESLSPLPAREGRQEPVAWRSMETAPKNGCEVILKVKLRANIPGKCLVGHYMAGGHCIEDHPPISEGWYFWNGCMFDKASEPVGWLPLPDDASPPALDRDAVAALSKSVKP